MIESHIGLWKNALANKVNIIKILRNDLRVVLKLILHGAYKYLGR